MKNKTETLKKLFNSQIPQTPKTTRFYSKFPIGFWNCSLPKSSAYRR
jgi:hypothetical protein